MEFTNRREARARLRAFIILLIFVSAWMFSGLSLSLPLQARAAAKAKLATPRFTAVTINEDRATLSWTKIKGAKTYRFYRVTTENYWKYLKSVAKNKTNQKKFSDKTKYKLTAAGKNYKVYTKARRNVYTRLRTLPECTYTFKGDYSRKYSFCVKAVNGDKVSALSAVKTIQTGKKPAPKQKYTVSYVLNGGTNDGNNPAFYYEGDSLYLNPPAKENQDFEGWFSDEAMTEPFSVGSKPSGNLTLYAKWHLAALNITGEGLEDMIWSWWYYPQAVSESGTALSEGSAAETDVSSLFWGFATKDGHCGVAKYDAATGTVSKTALKLAAADDHNGLALTLLEDKRIMACYAGGHNSDNEIHVRISDKPLDIRTFSTDIVLYSKGKTCYSQILHSSGKYYLFYRYNNTSWAYRSSADCLHWSEERILIKAGMQYYCRFMPTTEEGILRVLMYSNPSGDATEIRMGFFCTADDTLYDGSGYTADDVLQGKLPASANSYTAFEVLLDKPKSQTQRLFDCAITAPQDPRFLYARFSKKTKVNDSVYYLFDASESYEITKGGKALMDYKYQLGACFIDGDTIAAAHHVGGVDSVDVYRFDGKVVSLYKSVDSQIGTHYWRNARPIADVNGKAVLWHNGYYNSAKYTDFDTCANLWLMEKDSILKPATVAGKVNESARKEDVYDPITVGFIEAYANRLYRENAFEDYRKALFTWSQEKHERGWLYYNGFMLEAFLMADMDAYCPEILRYYDQHIIPNPAAGGSFNGTSASITTEYKIWQYVAGELDWALPAVGMIELLAAGKATPDASCPNRPEQYASAINYVYNQLELQTCYEDCGRLLQHSEREENGERVPTKSWTRWRFCLDGVFMSNLFLIHLAEAMDAGKITIHSVAGTPVESQTLWNDIYTRLIWVMENMRDAQTGLLYHGYSVEEKSVNGVVWGRGMGWYAMALTEAAEKMPDALKKSALQAALVSLMSSAIAYQDSESNLWYNVADCREEVYRNQPETSGSAMLAYCLLRGYANGSLKESVYRDAGLRALNAIIEDRFIYEGMTDTMIGMGVSNVANHYQNNRFVTNEAKGVAALIMAGVYADNSRLA